MDCLGKWCWIGDPNLWQNLQNNCVDSLELSWLPPPHTIPKETGRQNESIRNWNNTFGSLLIKDNDWDDLLPLAEFQYNNHVHTATQNVPFLLDTG